MIEYFMFIINLTTFFLQICGTQLQQVNTDLKLIINPPGHIVDKGPPILFQRVEDSLNLTCRLIKDNNEKLPNYNISWNWQYSQKNSANRVMMVSLAYNEANLVFKSLKETDSGEYTCKCPELNLFENVWIKVKPIKRTCSDKMFVCSNGNCIGRNFVCDGKEDCKFGTDEDPEYCGLNPCQGKIPCDNGRCIPTSWCCDEVHDPNCTTKHKPKCCQQLVRYIDTTDYVQHPFGDMGFLQTTIYTVIGCAMAFMLIVTILVIAICRVHLKRSVISRCPLNHQHHPGSPIRTGLPLYDIDMFLDRQQDQTGGLLVTYNINNGVQFVGRPVDPPPYCEIIDTPPREGPPPPYMSRENISTISEEIPTNLEPPPIAETSEPRDPGAQGASSSADNPAKNTSTTPAHHPPRESTKKTPKKRANISSTGIVGPSMSIVCSSMRFETSSSLKELSKIVPDAVVNSYEICNSVPSVSGVASNKIKNKNLKKNVLHDFSDSDTDSSYMENDALLAPPAKLEEKTSEPAPVNGGFLKSIIVGFKKSGSDVNSPDLRNVRSRKQLRPLLTQKSFDSSDRTRKELVLSSASFSKIVPNVTHSMGDLSPVNSDLNYNEFSGMTLPLRESHIGIRNEEA